MGACNLRLFNKGTYESQDDQKYQTTECSSKGTPKSEARKLDWQFDLAALNLELRTAQFELRLGHYFGSGNRLLVVHVVLLKREIWTVASSLGELLRHVNDIALCVYAPFPLAAVHLR
jgi:hypothetical protein